MDKLKNRVMVELNTERIENNTVDIHKSDIDELRQRVAKKNYKKYLLEMRLETVRALRGQRLRFDFPVTAVIGTNGGGKSTVLGSASIAYKSVRPRDYFPKANVGDNSMADWKIDYDIIDNDINAGSIIQKTAKFGSAKWRRDEFLDRNVLQFPIIRTVPAGEQSRYKRFQGMYALSDPHIENLPAEVATEAGRILGRDLTGYRIARVQPGDPEYILLGQRKGDNFSQFHFGAGEASIIEMVSSIEQASDYSLVVIEEIENGLHPIATEKMVEYLIGVAKRKKIQVIFTTHSEHALKRLPPEAKWAAVDGTLLQGDLSIESLRAITGFVTKDRVAFVEDGFAKDWVDDAIRQYKMALMPSIEVHSAGGYPFVLDVTKHHNENPTTISKAIAVIDGDAGDGAALSEGIFRLPGGIPESTVWSFVENKADELAGLLQQRLQIPQVSQETIIASIKAVSIDAGDPHLVFKKLGERLGYLSEIVVRRAFISIYNEKNADQISSLVENIFS